MSLRIFGAKNTSSAVVFIELRRRDRWSDMLDVSSPFQACIRIAQSFFCMLWSHLLKASHHPSIHDLPILHPLHRSDQRILSVHHQFTIHHPTKTDFNVVPFLRLDGTLRASCQESSRHSWSQYTRKPYHDAGPFHMRCFRNRLLVTQPASR